MSLPNQASPQMMVTSSRVITYNINQSLRFRASASANLNRTPAVSGSTTAWTMSFWAKLGNPNNPSFFAAGSGQGNGTATERMNLGSTLYWQRAVIQTANVYDNGSTAVVRDYSAWYHIVMVWDSNNATASLRQKYYLNGVLLSNNTGTAAGLGQNSIINSSINHRIGLTYDTGTSYGDFYLAEFNFIDGQILAASSFGIFDTNGIWQPIKYTGTYGTNGYYLNFSNTTSTTALGLDSSGNGNHWTVNNISLTTGASYDSMTDSPTVTSASVTNYATLNPLRYNTSGTISQANLNYSNGSGVNQAIATSTIGISTGKFYWEGTITQIFNDTSRHKFGFASSTSSLSADLTLQIAAITAGATAVGQVVMIAIDFDAGKIWYGAQGVWVSGGSPSTGANPYQTFTPSTYNYLYPSVNVYAGADGTSAVAVNFGQQPFAYSPPSGFYRLNTWNLSATTIPNGAQYMAATLYTGNGASNTISNGTNNAIGTTFQPDFVWIKNRAAAVNHQLQNSNAGWQYGLNSNNTNAEYTDANAITGVTSSGWSMNNNYNSHNQSGVSYVGWNWKASVSTVSNTNGSITSTVSANTTAGFSVVGYTGNATAGATVGHGLGVAPSFIIVKDRAGATSWPVYHASLGATNWLLLDSNQTTTVSSQEWNNTSPTSTVFSVGNASANSNQSAANIAYCWAAVPGYSAFGSYTGNGSTDGPFIYLGFRPRWWLVKRTDTVESWNILDSSRDPYNQAGINLYPNLTNAESSNDLADLVSNGVKLRNTWTGANTNGGTYIYAAFAENPFAIARAR